MDVSRGWTKALLDHGCDVLDLNFDERLDFYTQVTVERDGELVKAVSNTEAIHLAAKGIETACYEFWPDVVLIVSCFFVPRFTIDLIRSRGHKVAMLFTEGPYESDGQVERLPVTDLAIVNDPIDLDRYRQIQPNTHYIPHSYDPKIHQRREPQPALASDFCFVGTGFPSRVEFFEQADWSGLDVCFAGNWNRLDDDSPLRPYVAHNIEHCIDNTDAVDLYSATKASANLYRKEAERPELSEGWAMGPREVELAASETFFLRQPRAEGDAVLPMVPTFDCPSDFSDKLRWYLNHDRQRSEITAAAREAIADRTFANATAEFLRLLDA